MAEAKGGCGRGGGSATGEATPQDLRGGGQAGPDPTLEDAGLSVWQAIGGSLTVSDRSAGAPW